MNITFTLPGSFPGMNEILKAACLSRFAYAKMKEENTDYVYWLVYQLPKLTNPVKVSFTWYLANRKHDPDNVMAGQKFIFDGLVKAKIIPNDTLKYIVEINHRYQIDAKHPRVIVEIVET